MYSGFRLNCVVVESQFNFGSVQLYTRLKKISKPCHLAVGVKRNLISGRQKSDPLSPKENIISALNRESS